MEVTLPVEELTEITIHQQVVLAPAQVLQLSLPLI
jgi:hypothetical protein